MTQSVIVTGGFGILGQAVAQEFAAQGDKVTRIDFADKPADSPKGMLDLGNVDLTDPDQTQTALDTVIAKHNTIDVLVNVAGGFVWETMEDGSLDSWARMQAMNVTTAATIIKAALPQLIAANEARIINIGAGAAIKADMGMGAYAASKSAIHRMTEALAVELAGKDVTVNAVLPSIIDTPTNRTDMPDADFAQWVHPSAIAKVIAFLASPSASAVTGALIPVTRGS